MKKQFMEPTIRVVRFTGEHIIITSTLDVEDDDEVGSSLKMVTLAPPVSEDAPTIYDDDDPVFGGE